MAPTVYFVTGANRGIGFALVEALANRSDDVLIFATARDPTRADKLNKLAEEKKGKIVVLKLEVTSDEDSKKAAEEVKKHTDKVDVLIANAGISTGSGPVEHVSPADLHTVIDVNIGGPLRIFQALLPLLRASSAPRVYGISSTMGSIAFNLDPSMPPEMTGGLYTVSKSGLNSLFARIHREHAEKDKMTVVLLCPGHTQTDMGNAGAKFFGKDEAPVKLADSIKGLLPFIEDESGKYAGKFMSFDGAERPW